MQGSRQVLLAIITTACLLTGVLRAQETAAYTSARQAWDVFNASTDNAARTKAFEWVKERAKVCSLSEAGDICSALGKMARGLGREGDFEAAITGAMKVSAQEMRNSFAGYFSDWYADGAKYDEGLKIIMDCLGDAEETTPGQLAWLAQRGATILASRMSRHGDAANLLREILEKVKDDPASFATVANTLSPLLHTGLADAAGAEALSRQVLAQGDVCNASAYGTAAYQVALLEKEKGNKDDAVAALMLLLKHASFPPSGIAKRIVDYDAKPAALEESVRLLRERITAPAKDVQEIQTRCERIPEIVDLLVALGRYEEALREARVFVFTAADRNYPAAVDLVARMFKMVDGNLGRANAFLTFQQANAEKLGDLKNPFMDFPALNDPVRVEALKTFENAPQQVDWSVWLTRSVYLLWLDRPVEAMDAAAKAFAVSPMTDASLQTCAAATVRPLLVATRDTVAAQRVVDYMLWGETGPNGKMENPFPAMRQRLIYPTPK